MDIAIRVPLFYVLDLFFNKLTAPIKNISIPPSAAQNSSWVNNNTSSDNSSASAIEDVVSEDNIMDISKSNLGYTSHLSYPTIYFMITALMFMLLLTTPTKSLTKVSLRLYIINSFLYLGSFISAIFNFKFKVDDLTVAFIRVIFFFIIGTYVFEIRPGVIGLNPTPRFNPLAKIIIKYVYCLLSALNVQNMQCYLAKYILIFLLIFYSTIPQRTISLQEYFSKYYNRIKFVLIAITFHVIHLSPLVEWSTYGFYEDDGCSSLADRGQVMLRLFGHDVLIPTRVVVMLTVSFFFSFFVNLLVETFIGIEVNSNPELIGNVVDRLKRYLISPAFLFIFVVDKNLWHFDLEDRWSIVHIFITMYFATFLFNFCEIITRSMQSKSKNHKFQAIVIMLTLILAICMLGFALWGLQYRTETNIVFCLGFYSIIICTLYGLALIFIAIGLGKEASLLYLLKNVELYFKSLAIAFILICLLLVCYYRTFDLSVFAGAMYFGFKFGEEVREFMVSECEETTESNNQSRAQSLENLPTPEKCPQFQVDLSENFEDNENVTQGVKIMCLKDPVFNCSF